MVDSIRYSFANSRFFLAGVQYLKGRSLEYAIEFGVLWALVAVSIFAFRRFYNFRKNINCVICNDLPESKQSSADGK